MSIEVGRIGALGQKNTDTEGLYLVILPLLTSGLRNQ